MTPWSRVLLKEANSYSASQVIPRLLWNPKVHYRVHTFPPCSSKIHSHILIPFTPRSSEWSLALRFSDENFVCFYHLSSACYMPAHFIFLDSITLTIFGEAYKVWNSSLCSLLHYSATSSRLHSDILLSTLFLNTLNLCLSVVWETKFHTRIRQQVSLESNYLNRSCTLSEDPLPVSIPSGSYSEVRISANMVL